MNPKNNFKGPSSYDETDTDIFFGRDLEIENLLQLVKLNSLTLLFGKSGLGKSSLVKAGLFPRFRNSNFIPILIRPDYSSEKEDFVKYVYEELLRHLPRQNRMSSHEIKSGKTVWEFLQSNPFSKIDNAG